MREYTREIRAAGIHFHARQRGAEPAVLFLHGFAADLRTWDGVWAHLDNDRCLLRYDLRGFGLTPQGAGGPFSHSDDLLALLDAAGLDRVDLVGVSMGGATCVNFALDHPGRVRRLVLVSPALVAWEWSPPWRALWRSVVDKAASGDLDGARRMWWQHPLFETTRTGPGGVELLDSIQRYSGAHWHLDEQVQALPDVERIHLLRAPTLLLTGSRDLPDFRLIADVIDAAAGDVRRVDYAGRGHLLHLEAPDACAADVDGFLWGGETA